MYLYHLHHLYHVHAQNGYAYASLPSPLVYAVDSYSRDSRTRRLGKQPARMAQGLQPPIQLTAPRPVLAPRTSRTSTSQSSSNSVRVRGRPMSRRRKCMCTSTTPASFVLPHRLCSVNAGPAVARTVHAHTPPPHSHCPPICLQALTHPVVPGSVRTKWCIDNWGCVHPHFGCICRYQLARVLPSSISRCACPSNLCGCGCVPQTGTLPT